MNTFFYKDIAYPDGVIGGKDYYNPVIYSTNERLIGVWADNKPLYQKTVVFGSVSGTAASLPLNIANVDLIFLCADASSVNGACPLSYVTGSNYNNNIGGFFDVAANNTNFEIRIGSSMAGHIDSVIITAQYTKTTDTAGSAPYNNYGVPTVRYSTDEQIIGLWTDGKPLYRRVFNLNQSISNYQWTENILGTTGTGIYITDYKGFYGVGETKIPIDWFRSTSSNSCSTTNDYNDDISIRPNLDGIQPIVKYIIIEYTKTTD